MYNRVCTSEVFQFDAKDYGLEEKEEERMEENLVINATKPHKARRGWVGNE